MKTNTLKFVNNILLLLSLVLICSFITSIGHDYFPIKKDDKKTFEEFNAKGKLIGSYTEEVIQQEDNKATIKFQRFDSKDKVLYTGQYNIQSQEDRTEIDMKYLLCSYEQLYTSKNMKVKFDDPSLNIPNFATHTGTLNNGKITATVKNMGQDLFKIVCVVSDRKTVGKETITIQNKKYDCFKISMITRSLLGVSGKTIEVKRNEYYAKGFGLVKTEVYKLKNNSLISTIQIK